jgi:GNAT superfamily N-acetyltransferase
VADGWSLRHATTDDAPVIGAHRALMFREMGLLQDDAAAALRTATETYVRDAIPRGEYVGWLAHPDGTPRDVIAGAGLHRRPILPRPNDDGTRVLAGIEGLVLNVWVEPAWRRRGLAEEMMRVILAWARAHDLARVSLHASEAGRPIYQRLGFVPSSEMRLPG